MIYQFGDCELDLTRMELRRHGIARDVEPQVFDILRYLVERHERFVGKEEIHEAIWRHRAVSEAALSSRIRAARLAIGDTGAEQRLIRTVHGRGFRFVAPVSTIGAPRIDTPSAVPGTGSTIRLDEGTPVQEIRYCRTRDDVRLAYATSGSGQILVKTTSWLNHLEYDWASPLWRPWLDFLGTGRRLIRYDGRGNGLSDWDVSDLSLEGFVADLEAVADAAQLRRFVLLGISQGAAIAVSYAARHPERVSHLILYNGYARGWRNRGNREEIKWREALKTLIVEGWGQDNPAFRQVFTSLFIPGGSHGQMEWFNDMMRAATSPANAARLHEAFGRVEVTDLLGRIRTPTLVMQSRNDAVVPFEEGRLLAAAILGARFVPLNSANHVLLASEPPWRQFTQEFEQFLATPAMAGANAAARTGQPT